jgi:cyclase
MRRTRVIPTLLLKRRGFYKTKKFKDPVYLGDPINILKIFNDKEVDEICVLDIGATPSGAGPQLDYLGEFASECFVPLAYGGGITKMEQIREIFHIGIEKCVINSAYHVEPDLIKNAATEYGSQSVVVSIDVKKKLLGGYEVFSNCGTKKTGRNPKDLAREAEGMGAGEILLNAIDRDGVMDGYDLGLAEEVCSAVSVPVILSGGAGSVEDLSAAAKSGASAVAAGAFFVFTGPHRAVLINVPSAQELEATLP